MSAIVRPKRVELHGPAAADRGQRRDRGECQRHAEQQRQRALGEGLVAAREGERQDGQHAGAEDRQHAAQKCQKGQ